jgi:hypothetical protein
MEHYIIALKEAQPQPDAAPVGRRELYETGVAQSATFRRKLEQWLETEHLDSQVAHIGEPTAFSLISLTSTPKVAERIEDLPEVEYVVPGGEDIGIVE